MPRFCARSRCRYSLTRIRLSTLFTTRRFLSPSNGLIFAGRVSIRRYSLESPCEKCMETTLKPESDWAKGGQSRERERERGTERDCPFVLLITALLDKNPACLLLALQVPQTGESFSLSLSIPLSLSLSLVLLFFYLRRSRSSILLALARTLDDGD